MEKKRPPDQNPESKTLERAAPPPGGEEDLDNKTDWEQDHDEEPR